VYFPYIKHKTKKTKNNRNGFNINSETNWKLLNIEDNKDNKINRRHPVKNKTCNLLNLKQTLLCNILIVNNKHNDKKLKSITPTFGSNMKKVKSKNSINMSLSD
tara:strand:- start:367 stop:678 length:312 start_codon:yes stop_codon:yes gene_type:complete